MSLPIYCIAVVVLFSTCPSFSDELKGEVAFRNPKIFFIIPPYNWRAVVSAPCTSTEGLTGTCMTRLSCINNGGSPSGSCGSSGRGFCCVYQRSCGTNVSAPLFYFTNPDYPATSSAPGQCVLTAFRTNSTMCQLRIDFLQFTLAPPNGTGTCVDDYLFVGDSSVPRICGVNSGMSYPTGQRIYVDFANNANFQTLTVDTNNGLSFSRIWNLQITQIPCNSDQRGSLMYYNTTSGVVSSFNFGTSLPTGALTRQLDGRYGVYIRRADGYCSIEWSSFTTTSFAISNDTTTMTNADMGEVNCNHTYVIIPNSGGVSDRFCGNNFTMITSTALPFVLYVITQYNEGDIGNLGFQLNYRQLPC